MHVLPDERNGPPIEPFDLRTVDVTQAMPAVGDVSIVTRVDGAPVAAIETTDVRVVAFDAVDAEFAHAEGEGDRSLAWWRAAHTAYFGRMLAPLGRSLDGTSLVVCERFRLICVVGDGKAAEAS